MEAAEVAAEQAELALQSSQDEYAASLGAAHCTHAAAALPSSFERVLHARGCLEERIAEEHSRLLMQYADEHADAAAKIEALEEELQDARRILLRCFAFPPAVGLRAR